ncbi:MAG TPA: protein YgfX [Pseudomonadales bacterium]|nr:protein YgfX [Pseudomonadales bacterium]
MDRPRHNHPETLQLRLKPSRIARYYCVVVVLLSWLAIGLADLFLPAQALLMAVAGIYGWVAIRQLQALPFLALEYRNKNCFVCVDHVWRAVALERNIFVGAGMITLSFRLPAGKKNRAVLWPDSADADSLRRLRAVLLAR